MRVTVDATPLLGQRTGVGRYTEHLLTALVATGRLDVNATAFTYRGLENLPDALPPGVGHTARKFPARGLQAAWRRTELPPVEMLAGDSDIFHATNFILPPMRKGRGVVTIHDLAYLHSPSTVDTTSRALRQQVPQSIKRAGMICTPTETVAAQIMQAYNLTRDQLTVTPLGVDPEWGKTARPDAEVLQSLGLPADYILFVGTLEPRKNPRALIDAYRALTKRFSNIPQLVLAGPPGWGDALEGEDMASVITPGYLEIDALRQMVAGARVLVAPSLDEGFGLPPLEAMACGTAVVTSDIPVFAEVLGEHARQVPTDPQTLGEAILQTLQDDGPTSREARRAHAARSTWERCATTTITAYEKALA